MSIIWTTLIQGIINYLYFLLFLTKNSENLILTQYLDDLNIVSDPTNSLNINTDFESMFDQYNTSLANLK